MRIQLRRKKILEYLSIQEKLSVEEAVKLFKASPATIRRDFAEIPASYGGVARLFRGLRRKSGSFDQLVPFALREKWFSAEKRFLAFQVYQHIKDLKTIFIDGGSTTTHIATFLKNPQQVIITNSLPLCNMLSEIFPAGGGPEIIMTGGSFQPESGLLLGSNAEAAAADYHADAAIISARGITVNGIYNHNSLIAGINRTMIAHADITIIVADHSKIGVTAMNRVCGLREIDTLFTVETAENKSELAKIKNTGVKVFADCPFDNITKVF